MAPGACDYAHRSEGLLIMKETCVRAFCNDSRWRAALFFLSGDTVVDMMHHRA
jgi:hypothetical protein